MSRVLIIDSDLTGGDFAWKCAEWGHEVKLYQSPNKDRSPVWDMFGFPGIERVNNWEKEMPWAMKGNGIVVNLFNDKVITAKLDKWQAFGAKVFGPTMKSANLEHNRGAGMKFMQEHGIEVPKFHTFNTLDEVEKFAWKATQPYVFKTAGDEEDKSLTYCASDPADLVSWLETKKRHGLKLKGPLMLQEKINMIAEIGISAWMGKDGFLPHYNLNFEFKKNLAGDFGRAVGEEGTVTRYYDENSLATDMLLPFEEELLKLGHRGDFDVGMGVDDKGRLWPFEFSCRFGWPSTQILMACHDCDPVQWMISAVTTGEDYLITDNRTAVGVLLTRPPYPSKNDDLQSSVGYVVTGLEEIWEHVSPWNLMIEEGPIMKDGKVDKGPCYKTTGDYIAVITAKGADVHDCLDEVYAAVAKVKTADIQCRVDVGKRLEKELPKLKAFGIECPDW